MSRTCDKSATRGGVTGGMRLARLSSMPRRLLLVTIAVSLLVACGHGEDDAAIADESEVVEGRSTLEKPLDPPIAVPEAPPIGKDIGAVVADVTADMTASDPEKNKNGCTTTEYVDSKTKLKAATLEVCKDSEV